MGGLNCHVSPGIPLAGSVRGQHRVRHRRHLRLWQRPAHSASGTQAHPTRDFLPSPAHTPATSPPNVCAQKLHRPEQSLRRGRSAGRRCPPEDTLSETACGEWTGFIRNVPQRQAGGLHGNVSSTRSARPGTRGTPRASIWREALQGEHVNGRLQSGTGEGGLPGTRPPPRTQATTLASRAATRRPVRVLTATRGGLRAMQLELHSPEDNATISPVTKQMEEGGTKTRRACRLLLRAPPASPPRASPALPRGLAALAALPLAKDEPRSRDAPLSTRTRSAAHVHVARAARESPAASLTRTAGQSGHSARSRCAHASKENVTHTQRGSKPKPRWGGKGVERAGSVGTVAPAAHPQKHGRPHTAQ